MQWSNTGRFASLLAVLVITFVLLPVSSQVGRFREIHVVVFTVVLLAAAVAVSGSRRVLRYAGAGGIAAVGLNWAAELSASSAVITTSLAASALFIGFIVVIIFEVVREQDRVDLGTVTGGICIYLLLVLLFGQLFALIHHLQPAAYLSGGQPLASWTGTNAHSDLVSVFLYFSLTTITTLGYGDIVPVTSAARILCGAEAVIGQLYLAVFIGRLVGLYTAQSIWTGTDRATASGQAVAGAESG
jgi:voltage-gated potassium channel